MLDSIEVPMLGQALQSKAKRICQGALLDTSYLENKQAFKLIQSDLQVAPPCYVRLGQLRHGGPSHDHQCYAPPRH